MNEDHRGRRLIRVQTCQRCPFAHVEAGDLLTRYCCLLPSLPDVTDYAARGKMPSYCPLLKNDYRATADVVFSIP